VVQLRCKAQFVRGRFKKDALHFKIGTGRFIFGRGLFKKNAGRFILGGGLFKTDRGRFKMDPGLFIFMAGLFKKTAEISPEKAGRFTLQPSFIGGSFERCDENGIATANTNVTSGESKTQVGCRGHSTRWWVAHTP